MAFLWQSPPDSSAPTSSLQLHSILRHLFVHRMKPYTFVPLRCKMHIPIQQEKWGIPTFAQNPGLTSASTKNRQTTLTTISLTYTGKKIKYLFGEFLWNSIKRT